MDGFGDAEGEGGAQVGVEMDAQTKAEYERAAGDEEGNESEGDGRGCICEGLCMGWYTTILRSRTKRWMEAGGLAGGWRGRRQCEAAPSRGSDDMAASNGGRDAGGWRGWRRGGVAVAVVVVVAVVIAPVPPARVVIGELLVVVNIVYGGIGGSVGN